MGGEAVQASVPIGLVLGAEPAGSTSTTQNERVVWCLRDCIHAGMRVLGRGVDDETDGLGGGEDDEVAGEAKWECGAVCCIDMDREDPPIRAWLELCKAPARVGMLIQDREPVSQRAEHVGSARRACRSICARAVFTLWSGARTRSSGWCRLGHPLPH